MSDANWIAANAEMVNRDQIIARLADARDALETAYTGWATASTAQKDAALRQVLRVAAELVRLQLDEFETAGA
jgi:hypothetical protein